MHLSHPVVLHSLLRFQGVDARRGFQYLYLQASRDHGDVTFIAFLLLEVTEPKAAMSSRAFVFFSSSDSLTADALSPRLS